MTRILTILFLAAALPVMAGGAKQSAQLMQPAIVEAAEPTVTLTIYVTPNLQTPQWQVLTNISVPQSWIAQYTNQPTYSKQLVCDPITDPLASGIKIHWGTNSINFGMTTNFFVTGLPSTPVTFYATTYASSGQESEPSNMVTTAPDTNYPPLTVFFEANAPVLTKLAITK